MKQLTPKLKQNLKNWISDRVINGEPLMLNEFYSFMRSNGYTVKELKSLKSKQLRAKIRKRYLAREIF
jgi:hypothetical protein